MKPISINIVGPSKTIFTNEVQPGLRRILFRDLVRTIAPGGIIILSKQVQARADLKPLIDYLERSGIQKGDIRVRYPQDQGAERIVKALSPGLERSGLRFGNDVAERDDRLDRYFITTPAFQAVRAHKRHIVVGPKGSGKSAILRELAAGAQNSLVITPEHHATEVLEALRKESARDQKAAYATSWKYTLLVEIFRKVVQAQKGDVAALGDLRRYLIERNLTGDTTLFERFSTYLRRITQLKGKVGPVEGEISLSEELGRLFKMDEVLQLIPSLQRVLRKEPFTVYIDELDQSWTNSDTANTFLVALLMAAIHLRGISDNLHVVVFLRTEIFELLKPRLPQLDKLRSEIEAIRWSTKDLRNLIASRALDSLGIEQERVAAEDVALVLFPETMADGSGDGFDYVLSRTSLRPREVIQFCNIALETAAAQDQESIRADAILLAEEEFSSWKLEHLVAEQMYIYPGLNDVLERFRGRTRELSAGALDGIITEMLLNGSKPKLPDWVHACEEPSSLIRLLYDLEVLGIEGRLLDSQRQNGPVWMKYDFVFNRPKARPEESASFLFHPGLWKALQLV
jgi:hypothetical protein